MKCETCDKEVPTVGETHSMLVVLQKVTPDFYSYYQCESGSEYGGLTNQHFHCCHDEMVSGVRQCIMEHYNEDLLIPVLPQQVRLHRVVLRAGLKCKVCGKPLTTQAYRICLTVATPVNSVPDDSQNELGEWTCSLDHARESALKIVGAL